MLKRANTVFFTLVLLIALALPVFAAPIYAQDGANDVSAENCAVTAFDIAGQGNFYIGGSGGTVPTGLNKNQIVPPNLPDLQFVQDIGTQNVAILVIDDFFAYKDEVAHGRVVTDALVTMIRANPVYATKPQRIANDEAPVIWAWETDNAGKLLVVEVDTANYDTTQLKDRVETAVNLVHDTYDVNRVVLNMSFVLLPCVTPDYDLKAQRANRVTGETVRTPLLTAVAEKRDISIKLDRKPNELTSRALDDDRQTRAVVNVISQYASRAARDRLTEGDGVLDPLHDYILELTGEDQYWNTSGELMVVAVGSAGNFGRPFDSFVPGAWPEVLSTSAFIGLNTPWVSSNRGQVMLVGGVYPVGDAYVIGTSFSAPVLSMNLAFYLTQDALCSDPPLDVDIQTFRDETMAHVINAACDPAFVLPPK